MLLVKKLLQQELMTVPEKEDDKLQNLHPEAVLLTAELLGNLSALHMPFNVQNLSGNWLTLIGQAILVFNAQQQLQRNGVGECYCPYTAQIQETAIDHTTRRDTEKVRLLEHEVRELSRQIKCLQRQMEQRR